MRARWPWFAGTLVNSGRHPHVFSWIEWPDKETRDVGMAKVMKDPRMNMDTHSMPFDGKRMIFGGFAPIIEVAADARPHHLLARASSHARDGSAGWQAAAGRALIAGGLRGSTPPRASGSQSR